MSGRKNILRIYHRRTPSAGEIFTNDWRIFLWSAYTSREDTSGRRTPYVGVLFSGTDLTFLGSVASREGTSRKGISFGLRLSGGGGECVHCWGMSYRGEVLSGGKMFPKLHREMKAFLLGRLLHFVVSWEACPLEKGSLSGSEVLREGFVCILWRTIFPWRNKRPLKEGVG